MVEATPDIAMQFRGSKTLTGNLNDLVRTIPDGAVRLRDLKR